MSKFDWSDLDARLLQLLVTVVEAGSVTRAAQSLGVTQSAVSHQLDKLRSITGDALFVKSGRGIVATARAGELAVQARELLRQLQGLARQWKPIRVKPNSTLQRLCKASTILLSLYWTASTKDLTRMQNFQPNWHNY